MPLQAHLAVYSSSVKASTFFVSAIEFVQTEEASEGSPGFILFAQPGEPPANSYRDSRISTCGAIFEDSDRSAAVTFLQILEDYLEGYMFAPIMVGLDSQAVPAILCPTGRTQRRKRRSTPRTEPAVGQIGVTTMRADASRSLHRAVIVHLPRQSAGGAAYSQKTIEAMVSMPRSWMARFS